MSKPVDKEDPKNGQEKKTVPPSDTGQGVAIYFLLPQGKTQDTCAETLSDAYDQSDESGLSPVWISTDKVLGRKPTKTVRFYIFTYYANVFFQISYFSVKEAQKKIPKGFTCFL